MSPSLSRRDFIASSSAAALAFALPRALAQPAPAQEPLIDIHMHQNAGPDGPASSAKGKGGAPRTIEEFLQHQQNIAAVTTVILGANESTKNYASREPGKWVCFCRHPVTEADAHEKMERELRNGAIGIGELKDPVTCDAPQMQRTAELAREYDVPMLIHFEDGGFNDGFQNFHRMLDKFPTVKFIGHGQTWWAHINKDHKDEDHGYPKGPVTPGGLTDRWLNDYPNLYSDLSANSGNNALMRDPAFARDFMIRQQNKHMFGSDCPCRTGVGPTCVSATKRAALDKLQLGPAVMAKVLRDNARRLLRLKIA